jgi:hypothetical protein
MVTGRPAGGGNSFIASIRSQRRPQLGVRSGAAEDEATTAAPILVLSLIGSMARQYPRH